MDTIGGYFDLELKKGEHYHKAALRLNTARNCLEYIIRSRQYSKVYIPFYTCNVILEPLNKCGIIYEFYHINEELEPIKEIVLNDDEAFLYTNYFGLKQNCVKALANTYGKKQLIVDNSQAFFTRPLQGVDTFYSARKFFGVPDGAYLYCDAILDEELKQDVSYLRMTHLLKRIDLSPEDGYDDFKINDKSLENQPIQRMSKLTEKLLKSIDYKTAKAQRIENFKYLQTHLTGCNLLKPELKNNVPMIFPFLTKDKSLKKHLIENKIFTPTYWHNVKRWTTDSWENILVNNLVCLPIDQRYNENDMIGIVNKIDNAKNNNYWR
jgi:hypothetical protein